MICSWQIFGAAALLGVASLTSVAAAQPNDSALQHACFSPAALAGLPGEERAAKGIHTFDAPTKLGDFKSAAPISDALRGSIRRVDVPKGEKVIALTFDLCEQRGEIAGYDGRIIDYLREQGVKATFFAGGKWMASHQSRTEQLMLDPLFEVGNHTETHANLRLLSPAAVRQQVLAPQKVYEDTRAKLSANQCVASSPGAMNAVPLQPTVFRFPYGACNAASMKAVNDAGMMAIQWDVATGDPDPHVSAKRIAEAMVNEAKPGSIIVSHANGRGWHTAEALPIAIPKLKAKGYRFVTVSELIAMGKPVITAECYDRKPGDTNRYDFLWALQRPLNSNAKMPKFATSAHSIRSHRLKRKGWTTSTKAAPSFRTPLSSTN
ncbi:polysaccharide deacetylase family protein [Hyphomicrobium sp.]|jgi:peptidoglycan/xylan/chitin deacetylase (PgdA/CDA1 family)|uniref:polysaccharide deacetylase family protein n=1 Tax=Hyphomicrobium sp. TaxID=82 RepID=UPI002BCF13C4|nr:polysaccharide deacetylase family protein [Hyphomicrobium sp.]HVZ05344.1 polysaccharide deacetylase family protein [Hyphomicrobium sp.]